MRSVSWRRSQPTRASGTMRSGTPRSAGGCIASSATRRVRTEPCRTSATSPSFEATSTARMLCTRRYCRGSRARHGRRHSSLRLAGVARKQGRFSDAEALYEEALASFESIGDDASIAFVCVGLADVHVDQGRFDMARVRLRRALSLLVSLRSPVGISLVLDIAAVAATDARSAARLLGKSDELGRSAGRTTRHQSTFLRAGRRRRGRRAWRRAIRCGLCSGPCAVA